jgi:hypothetical protein
LIAVSITAAHRALLETVHKRTMLTVANTSETYWYLFLLPPIHDENNNDFSGHRRLGKSSFKKYHFDLSEILVGGRDKIKIKIYFFSISSHFERRRVR